MSEWAQNLNTDGSRTSCRRGPIIHVSVGAIGMKAKPEEDDELLGALWVACDGCWGGLGRQAHGLSALAHGFRAEARVDLGGLVSMVWVASGWPVMAGVASRVSALWVARDDAGWPLCSLGCLV